MPAPGVVASRGAAGGSTWRTPEASRGGLTPAEARAEVQRVSAKVSRNDRDREEGNPGGGRALDSQIEAELEVEAAAAARTHAAAMGLEAGDPRAAALALATREERVKAMRVVQRDEAQMQTRAAALNGQIPMQAFRATGAVPLAGDNGADRVTDALTCPLCLEPFCDPCTLVPCGHSFCCHCLCKWLDGPSGHEGAGASRCPMCSSPTEVACLSYALRGAAEAKHAPDIAAGRLLRGESVQMRPHFVRRPHAPPQHTAGHVAPAHFEGLGELAEHVARWPRWLSRVLIFFGGGSIGLGLWCSFHLLRTAGGVLLQGASEPQAPDGLSLALLQSVLALALGDPAFGPSSSGGPSEGTTPHAPAGMAGAFQAMLAGATFGLVATEATRRADVFLRAPAVERLLDLGRARLPAWVGEFWARLRNAGRARQLLLAWFALFLFFFVLIFERMHSELLRAAATDCGTNERVATALSGLAELEYLSALRLVLPDPWMLTATFSATFVGVFAITFSVQFTRAFGAWP